MTVIAGSVPLLELLGRLASRRPVFHSEADLQHAFAWEAHCTDPQVRVRLETHPEPDIRLDLLVSRPDLHASTAVELKYLTARWAGTVDGEQFALKHQSAQDIRGYDVVKDIHRLERIVSRRPGWNGVFIALSNDSSYWRPATHGRATNADAFRLHDGVTLSGSRTWGPATGAGTMKNRQTPITLLGTYPLRWRDYSRQEGGAAGSIRCLVVEVNVAAGTSPASPPDQGTLEAPTPTSPPLS